MRGRARVNIQEDAMTDLGNYGKRCLLAYAAASLSILRTAEEPPAETREERALRGERTQKENDPVRKFTGKR